MGWCPSSPVPGNFISQPALSLGAAGLFCYIISFRRVAFTLKGALGKTSARPQDDGRTGVELDKVIRGQGVELQHVPCASHNDGLQASECIPLAHSAPHN